MALSFPVARLRTPALVGLLAIAAGSSFAQERFKVSGDGQEVFDSSSRLTWRRCAEGMRWSGQVCAGKALKFSYAGAKKKTAGAWRLPNREELVGIVEKNAKKKPRIDTAAFPQTPALPFWATRPGSDDNLNAWLVSFSSGKVKANLGQAKFPLRLVRTGN